MSFHRVTECCSSSGPPNPLYVSSSGVGIVDLVFNVKLFKGTSAHMCPFRLLTDKSRSSDTTLSTQTYGRDG